MFLVQIQLLILAALCVFEPWVLKEVLICGIDVVAQHETVTLVEPLGLGVQPTMTADILGVDAQGQTTWGLHEVVEEDSTTLIATATLVEGPDLVSITFSIDGPLGVVAFGGNCALSAGSALCVQTVSSKTITQTLPVSTFVVEVGTIALASKGAPSSTASKTGASSRLTSSIWGTLGSLMAVYQLL
ncbi:hypothetical protein C8J57DRAFT_1287558 [Mycena rebaudengoi]|nr:hypothetical protein C8J57DRAFT_1287558 [Mycena rebaudengoi]